MGVGSEVVPAFSPALSAENESSNDSSSLELISRVNINTERATEHVLYGPSLMGGGSTEVHKRRPTNFNTVPCGSSQQRYHPYGAGAANFARGQLEGINRSRDPHLSSPQDNALPDPKSAHQTIITGSSLDTCAERASTAGQDEKTISIQSFIERLDAENFQAQASPLNKAVGSQNTSTSIGNDEVLRFVAGNFPSTSHCARFNCLTHIQLT